MASSGIYIKFKIFSATDVYFAVGSSSRGSFNKKLGTGAELLAGRNDTGIESGIEVFASIDLGGTFGNFNVRLYAENELGIRSAYDEKVTQVMGNDLGDNTFSFADVFCKNSEVTQRSMSGTMFEHDNNVNINLNFSGDAPQVAWTLFAPPGHPSEGEVLSSNETFDRLLRGFDLCFYREGATSGTWEKIDSDSDKKTIQDTYPNWNYKDGKWWIGFLFEIDIYADLFKALAGTNNPRKLKLEVTARTITFAANAAEKTCTLNLILENEKTKLLSKFINTIKNDLHFSFEVDDIDFNKLLVRQYIKNADSDWVLSSRKEVANLSSAEKKSASVVLPQKWSNGRGSSVYRNQYQYIIEVYDAFGLSSVYCPKTSGALDEIASNYTVTDTTGKIFESIVKINKINIASVGSAFDVSWNLADINGNSISFKEDELDQIAVVKGIVGYFHDAGGSHVVDAFDVSDTNRFETSILKSDLRMVDLKQETFRTLVDNITFEENARIQTGLYGGSIKEASRTLQFTLAILDAAGEVIDEETVSATNAQPAIKQDGFSFDVFEVIGSVKFNLEFNEKINHIEIYRRPELKTTTDLKYAQKSPSGTGSGDYSMTEDTVRAAQYNTSTTLGFGEDAGSKNRSTAAGYDFIDSEYLVKTQTTEGTNSLSINDSNQCTLVDENVPMLRDEGVLENFTDYDYILVPYDGFGAGVPFIVDSVNVASYKLFSRNDQGFVGVLDTKAPEAPTSGEVKTSFKNWFLTWTPASDGEKSVEYKVTMVRDLRTAQEIDAGTAVSFTKNTNSNYTKWSRDVTGAAVNDLHMATVFKADGSKAEVSIVENNSDSVYLDRLISNISETSGALTLDSYDSSKITVEQFFCSTPSLQIEGETNQTGYFFIEAIDKTGNHSKFLQLDSGFTLGQTKVTDIATFEQDITGKIPGSIALVPKDPFSVSGSTLSWIDHFIYKDGEAHYIKEGSISLTEVKFVGDDIPSSVVDRFDEWGQANANRFIKYVYWNPDGGYNTETNEFKEKVTASDTVAWKKLNSVDQNSVDQNITFESQGYYSFSMFNPSSASYNIEDEGHSALYNGTGLTHEDYFGSSSVQKKNLDLEIFNNATWETYRKYGAGNAGSTDEVNKGIRKHYGIHMPLEAEGEVNSHGQRTPLVKSNSGGNAGGSIVIARINKINGEYSVSSAWHSFANAVIGSAMIDQASIKSAHINDLTADTITGGTIRGHEIILGEKAEEANQHGNIVNSNTKFSKYGIIKSENYAGIYSSVPGFWINGDGTFSFSTSSGSSLSFEDNELVLRGRLVQPSGAPVAAINLNCDTETIIFDEIQVEGHPEASLIEDPVSEKVNFTVDINNAIFSDGTPLTSSQFRVKVYPGDLSAATGKSLASFKSSTSGNCYLSDVYNANAVTFDNSQDINEGLIKFELNFTDYDNSNDQEAGKYNHKFLSKTESTISIPDFFTVDVELFFDSGLISYNSNNEYYSGDVVIHGGNSYTALQNVPKGKSISDTSYWQNTGAGSERIVATQRKIIRSFIEPSSALVYELKATPGSQIMQNTPFGSGAQSEVSIFGNYGTESRAKLDEAVTDVWALNSLDYIKIYRKTILTAEAEALVTPFNTSSSYNKGDIVTHSSNTYISIADSNTTTPPTITGRVIGDLASSKWNPISEVLIGEVNSAKDAIEYIEFGLSDEETDPDHYANKIYRESFGFNKAAALQVNFTAEYDDSVIVQETVDMVPSGMNAGVLTFHTDAGMTEASLINIIGRSVANRRMQQINQTVYWKAVYSSGRNTIASELAGSLSINTSAATKINKSDITISTSSLYTRKIDVDDINDVKRISILITSVASGASAKEEISIVNEVDVPRNLNLVIPRQFIFFSREQGSVKQNVLRLENVVPFQVLYGQENAPINSDDVLAVVPSFGYIVNGKAMAGILENGTHDTTMNFGDVVDSATYGNIKTEFYTAIPTLIGPRRNSVQEYQIYKEGTVWAFKEKVDTGSAISEIQIKNSDDYYYLIPKNASGNAAAAKAGKVSVKATLKINDQGIDDAASKITFKDVQQFNMIELAKDGENPLLSSATNSSITANADESKNIVNATRSAGLSVIEVFRGNKKVFLAPNKITLNSSTFTLDTSVGYIKYTGDYDTSSIITSFSLQDTEGETIAITNSSIENFESITSDSATELIVENSTTNLPSDDARKRKVVLLNSSGQALAHFTLNWRQEGYELSLSVDDFIQPFSQADQTADNIDCSIANLNFDRDVNLTEPSTSPSASKPLVTLYTRNNQVEACIDLSGMNEANQIKDTSNKEHTSMSFGFPVKVYISRLSQTQTLTTRINLGVSQQGKAGPSFQFRGGYSPDAKYYGDDVSQDMVTYKGPNDTEPKFYYVNRGFTKDNGGYDSTTSSNADYIRGLAPGTSSPKQYWNQIENELQPTATSLLLADDILVKKGIVVGIATDGSGDATASGFIASQLEPQFLSLDLRGNIIDDSDFDLSATGNREAQVFDSSGRFVGLSDLGTASASGKAHKTPRDFNPGFFLGSHPATYLKSGGGNETFLTSQLEMYSPFGNYLRWDGKNLIIKGGLIHASAKDENMSLISSSASLLTLKPTNSQVGSQTFIGGGFNNKILNSDASESFPTLASSIVGGGNNIIFSSGGNNARFSSICGGFANKIGDSFSTIGGGYYNTISVDRTEEGSSDNTEGINAILSGSSNSIENSSYSFIGTGYANSITSSAYGSILNGFNNYIGGGTTTEVKSVTNYESSDVVDEVYVKGFAEVNGESKDVLNENSVTDEERYRIILEEKYNDEEKIQNLIDEGIPSYVNNWSTDSNYRLFKSIKNYKLYIGFDKSSHFANEAFNIFNELTFDPTGQHNASDNYRTYGTGYFADANRSKEVLIRVGTKSSNPDRSFKVGYFDGSTFKYFKVKTHTNLWPYLKINGSSFNSSGCFKIKQENNQVVIESPDGTEKNITSITSSTAQKNSSENTPSNPDTGVTVPTEGQVSVVIPDPVTTATSKFSFNSIFGGDYNQIVSARRSTVVGGRNNKIKFVERALVSGVDNLIIGEENGNTGTVSNSEMPEGFIVFGRDNQTLLSGLGGEDYSTCWRQINDESSATLPTDYGGMSNVIFGGANLIRNSARTVVLGSANELLMKTPSGDSAANIYQVASEVTILGTDNKINVDSQVEASNLGIFGTNFNLTEPEMVQNTFYIGNPQVDDTVDISRLTRVFVAADGGAFFTGDVISFALSDSKYKDNIKTIENPIDKILKINGVNFNWKDNQKIYSGADVGVIAQEIKEVLPEVVEESRLGLKVKYEKITPLLIEAIKEQQSEIEQLKSIVLDLKSAVDELKQDP